MTPHCIPEEERQGPMWEAFCFQMQGRWYGCTETLDAWHWFRYGWNGHVAQGVKDLEHVLRGHV